MRIRAWSLYTTGRASIILLRPQCSTAFGNGSRASVVRGDAGLEWLGQAPTDLVSVRPRLNFALRVTKFFV
jgi:hypothetical protein